MASDLWVAECSGLVDRVLDKGLPVLVSPPMKPLCCALEQDSLSAA